MDLGAFLSSLSEKTLHKMACAAGLAALGSVCYWTYCRIQKQSDPPFELPQPDTHAPVSDNDGGLDERDLLQVNETNWQLVPADLPPQEAELVACGGRELSNACQIIQRLSNEDRQSPSESIEIKRYFISVAEGSEIQQWWFTITETRHLDYIRFPYYTTSAVSFTGIQSVGGKVTEVLSCRRLETSLNDLQEYRVQTTYTVTKDYMRMWADGVVDTAHWVRKSTFDTPGSDSESESGSEASEESQCADDSEIPFISNHLAHCGITDLDLKLPALRQVFSTLLTNTQVQNFLFVSWKELVFTLTALNKKNKLETQRTFESLIRFVKASGNQSTIELELLDVQLQFNILDVVYELIIFGWFINVSAPEFAEGGFLDKLFEHIRSWDVDVWEPAAEEGFTALLDHLVAFLELLFSQPLELYQDAEGLDRYVLGLLKENIKELLNFMKKF